MAGMDPDMAGLAGHPDRAPAVRTMFDHIAPGYDRANRWLSLGLDRRWRRAAVRGLGAARQGVVLDLCAGTLDMTRLLLTEGAERVHAIDFSAGMLDQGRRRLPPGAPVEIQVADARQLPLEDGSVDGIVCAFGLRNVPEPHLALAECARVLRPGGRLVVLEFFQPRSWLSRALQASYNRLVVPRVGGWLTGAPEAYAYLSRSIEAFCSREELQALCGRLGMAAWGREVFPPVASLVVAVRQPGSVVQAVEAE